MVPKASKVSVCTWSSASMGLPFLVGPPLPKHFIHRDPHARREIERADAGRQDRHRDQPIAVSILKLGRQPAGFTAEDQDDAVRGTEPRVPDQPRRSGREEIRLAGGPALA